jgi:MFS family permease
VLASGFALVTVGSALLGLFPAQVGLFYLASSLMGFGIGSVVGGALRFVVLNEVASTRRAAAQGLVNIGISSGQSGGGGRAGCACR